MRDLGAILTAAVTPFDGKGQVDMPVFRELLNFLIDSGSDGVVVAGTTGESPTLDDSEKLALFEAALDEIGDRAVVIAGTGSNDTAHSVKLTKEAGDLGVHGVLVVTPYYNKPPRAGIAAHFSAVAAATEVPVIIYNIPGRCVINLEPDLLIELGQIENIVAVKQANNDLEQARQIVANSSLALYSGDDNLLLPFAEIGGIGGICVSSHFAGAQMKNVFELARGGDLEKAREIDESISDFYETLFITSATITTKAGLKMMGINCGGVRLPLVEANEIELEQIKKMLENHDLLAMA